jgi:hypothetical protein
MRRGSWHQFGDKSQKFIIEQLQNGNGVGIVLSSRDLPLNHAIEYTQRYHGLGADVLIDLQFYKPNYRNEKMESYPVHPYRLLASTTNQISDTDLATLTSHLYSINHDLAANGLIAPALIYEAGRQDIMQKNEKLYYAAKNAGDSLGIPTYATVVIGRSAISSDSTTFEIISHATALKCDGYYYAFEFAEERIPSQYDTVFRCCVAGLILASTGLPVLHAYAGPMALLSLGFGATGAAIGHNQNTWRFTRERWEISTSEQGGGGDAPARLFSSNLWGTVIYPDEYRRFNSALRTQILTLSPFIAGISQNPPFVNLTKWQALKHFVFIIGSHVSQMGAVNNPRINANTAITLLQQAVSLHSNIPIHLADNTNSYQQNWLDVMNNLLTSHSDDYEYLTMLP